MDLTDITGNRYGRLTVLAKSAEKCASGSKWVCKCDCGNIIITARCGLTSGHTKSCGCLRHITAITRKVNYKHGGSHGHDRLYKVWDGMKARCNNPHNSRYDRYGGRGIKVCKEWNDDYMAFKAWAMKAGYDPTAPRGKCTIDRIDNNGNYEPSNCRWVDNSTQQRNKGRRNDGLN